MTVTVDASPFLDVARMFCLYLGALRGLVRILQSLQAHLSMVHHVLWSRACHDVCSAK